MSFFPSFADDATLPEILTLNRAAGRALMSAYEAAHSPGSRLTAVEKEAIAHYVSSLNETLRGNAAAAGCESKSSLASAFQDETDSAVLEGRLAPILAYARKLTVTPSKLTAVDANAVLTSGWTERDLQDTILIAALSVYMNCLQDGHGLTGVPSLGEIPDKTPVFAGAVPLRWLE
ncbi:MAG TPA: hypothetical protein VLC09_11215 [Polyangiaceae bacterium]|nr:hypothetical protein [Polyangiaceae bacterium]